MFPFYPVRPLGWGKTIQARRITPRIPPLPPARPGPCSDRVLAGASPHAGPATKPPGAVDVCSEQLFELTLLSGRIGKRTQEAVPGKERAGCGDAIVATCRDNCR